MFQDRACPSHSGKARTLALMQTGLESQLSGRVDCMQSTPSDAVLNAWTIHFVRWMVLHVITVV